MKKASTLCIASLLVASASAATFDAKGRSVKDNQLSNPGIAKYSKSVIKKENKLDKSNLLAKAGTPTATHVIQVTPYEGRFSTSNNSYTLKVNGVNKDVSTMNKYVDEINDLESNDAPRNNSNNNAAHYQNSHVSTDHYDYKSDNDNCKITSTSYNYNAFFNYVYADILYGLKFSPTYPQNPQNPQGSSSPIHGCSSSGTYSNTCASGINIYNVVPATNPITLNGNNCTYSPDNQNWLNYSYRIQHYNANQFLATASPNATLHTVTEQGARSNGVYMPAHYFNGKGGFEWHFFSNSVESNTAPHVGNIISSSRKNVTEYTTEAASIDEYIYYTRAIEFAAYTEEGKKTGPGTALNTITVGPANADGYVLKRDVVSPARFHPTASAAGINKPEIYSLSYAYNTYDDFSRKVKHDNNEYEIFGLTDSWGASTTASAMAADLLSKYPFYKWHPELVKALMKTANNRAKLTKVNHSDISEITSSNITTNSQTMHTAHLTSFEEMLRNNVSRYWYGNNNNFFSNDKMNFTENVDRGGKYNIAIAWLIQGRYAWDNKSLSTKYTFRIYDDATGKKLAENISETSQSTLRYSEIDIPSNVSRIRVEIERNRNTGDRVILGFNMHKVTQ